MRLVIVVGLLAVTVIALIVALTLQMAVFRKEEYKEMCQSEECIKTGIFFRRLVIYFRKIKFKLTLDSKGNAKAICFTSIIM